MSDVLGRADAFVYTETFAINLFYSNTALKTCSNRRLHRVNISLARVFSLSLNKIVSLQRSHTLFKVLWRKIR